jgi:hypothetical protein
MVSDFFVTGCMHHRSSNEFVVKVLPGTSCNLLLGRLQIFSLFSTIKFFLLPKFIYPLPPDANVHR